MEEIIMFFTRKRFVALAMAGITALALLAAGCGSDSASSDQGDIMKKIHDRGYVKVGVKEDVPLFGYKNTSTGEIEGLEVDLAKQIAKTIFNDESKVQFTPVVAKTRGPLLDSGELDMIVATYTINEERKKQYDFSQPYYTDPVGLLVKKDAGIQSFKDLDGKTIAIPQGATTKKVFEEAAKNAGITIKFVEFSTYPECKAALMSGRADAYGMDKSNLAGYVDDQTEILPDAFAAQNYGVATKKGNESLAKIVNDTITKLKDDDGMTQLLTKWKLNR